MIPGQGKNYALIPKMMDARSIKAHVEGECKLFKKGREFS